MLASKCLRPALASSKGLVNTIITPRASILLIHQSNAGTFITQRQFSFTPNHSFESTKAKSLTPTAPQERTTKPSWPHPIYTEKQMEDIEIAHRKVRNLSDYVAISAVKLLRSCFDMATGYKHDKAIAKGEKDPKNNANGQFAMTENKWMVRFIFLESIAGVPGFVAGSLRHLKSLRTLRRDNGWIETLLEEGYNERMHLLTFLKLHDPGLFMRLMIIGAQGVFYNAFFLSYLISPRTCHRFVGYLEEEAVITYTRAIADIDAGKLPGWKDLKAPEIAIQYWNMKPNSSMRDVLLYIRADEAKHREVNHTLANLDPKTDPNPFLSTYEDPTKPHPTKDISNIKSTGWERDDALTK